MKPRTTPHRAPWFKACGSSLLIHGLCITAIAIFSAPGKNNKSAQPTAEEIFTLAPDESAPSPAVAETGAPEPQPIPAITDAPSAATDTASTPPTPAAPLLSELPSYLVTAAGELIGDTRKPAVATPEPPLAKPPPEQATPQDGALDMDSYFAIFTQTLKDAYKIPNDIGSVRQYSVRIQYEVAADGTIGAITVLRTSGSAIYDASVVAAFRAMRNIGPRPDGRHSTLVADFKI